RRLHELHAGEKRHRARDEASARLAFERRPLAVAESGPGAGGDGGEEGGKRRRDAVAVGGGKAAADIERGEAHAGSTGDLAGNLDVAGICLWIGALRAGVKGQHRPKAGPGDQPQQISRAWRVRAEFGPEILG